MSTLRDLYADFMDELIRTNLDKSAVLEIAEKYKDTFNDSPDTKRLFENTIATSLDTIQKVKRNLNHNKMN